MLWLARPPYLRWAAMVLVVVVALVVDLRDQRSELRPFASRDIARGAPVDGAVEWRAVAADGWRAVEVAGTVAATDIRRGDPVTASSLSRASVPPEHWWSIELDLPKGAAAGRPARIVVADPPLSVDGIVGSVSDGGAFAATTSGLIAVPPDTADAVARAAAVGRARVLLGVGGG